MKVHGLKAYRNLKAMVFSHHHHIGEKHVPTSEMEKHLVDGVRYRFHDTDRQGLRNPLGHCHFGFRIGF